MRMRLLALDTSTEILSVAVLCDGRIHSRAETAGSAASERVLPLITQLLDEAGVAGRSLDAIAFGEGPGSFTGLRIACAVAQGLGEAWGLRLVPVSSFMAAAESVLTTHGAVAARVVVAFDARMREIYLAALEHTENAWRFIHPAQVARPETVPLPSGPGLFGCGDGFARYPILKERMAADLVGCDAAIFPSAHAVATLAAEEVRRGRTLDPSKAHPTYLRDKVAFTAAELRRQADGRAA
jgi:tRNA threonylcarbamoyladenosine biosynthesis protein TsaB